MPDILPDYDAILEAAKTIEKEAVRTPLLRCDALDTASGCKVYVKAENLQRTGSFKFRGAYNAISNLSEEERAQGILASSSGNHAQGVAAACGLFKCAATIIMPSDAPATKIERTKALGAEIVLYDRATEDRDALLTKLAGERGCLFVHPFENPMVIAGQGTTGLEVAQDMEAMDITPDRVIACTGGGGLTAGMAIAIHHHFPQAKIHSAEPEGFDDYKRSLEAGKIVSNAKPSGSICDAIVTPSPGTLSFAINSNLLDAGLIVSDKEALAAVKFAFEELKLVVEPGGAVALASVLKFGKQWKGECVVVTLSGGNIDPDMFARALAV
jgi:threonine dehydratase